jgi:hypothetical protein
VVFTILGHKDRQRGDANATRDEAKCDEREPHDSPEEDLHRNCARIVWLRPIIALSVPDLLKIEQPETTVRTLAILVSLAGTFIGASQKPPAVDDVLRAAAAYVEVYEPQLSGVVSEEAYHQTSRNARGQTRATRLLRSDTLLIRTAAQGWFGFRDVFEVDGKPVRDRDERLSKLFLNPSAGALEQAKRIADESARFNIGTQDGTLIRTINLPTIALAFLRREFQNRSAFKSSGLTQMNGIRAASAFRERGMPR